MKFHKNKIPLYSYEISKTIYNFYWQSYDDIKLIFYSNTEKPRSNIFEKNGVLKKTFILHSLIKYHFNLNKQNKEKISKHIKRSGISCNECTTFYCNNCITNFVRQNIDFYPSAFKELIDINENVNIDEFTYKIQFVFEDKGKIESIAFIKGELLKLLKDNFKRYTRGLDDFILEAIIQKIAISFFDTTVFNSIIKNKETLDYQNHKKLSRENVIEFINNYTDFLYEYKTDVLELEILELVEEANLDKEKILFKFKQEYKEYLKSKKFIHIYNSSSIKEYFKKNGMRFKTEAKGNEVVKRFILYNEGLGLIAYLMTLKINQLSIFEDKLFIRANFDKFLFIKNERYYEYKFISKYVNKNKKSENDFYRYAQIGDISLLETISENCLTPSIKIDKLGDLITLDEYQKINKIPSDSISKLKDIVSTNTNILIISSPSINKKPFLNALISSIPHNLSSLIIAEDITTLPEVGLQNQFVIVDSLKEDYETNIVKLSSMIGINDKCIALIDNYELDHNIIHKHQVLLLNKAKSLITMLYRNPKKFRGEMTFEKINKELSLFKKKDFSMFDYFIILDNYYVQKNKQDVIRIIGKKRNTNSIEDNY
ncbi:hypothetical protein MOD04_20810 [Bacillus inaquosorum]|uniref:hypothetical protein n=1 Tax=Bacillus inaquosorum TaxID=483913 RepID=UPI00227EF7CE|nr:hypothetical protein [Bacillus inaquosorum]MCY8323197.1 hypothetical protein [Bacillus inaquosorum]